MPRIVIFKAFVTANVNLRRLREYNIAGKACQMFNSKHTDDFFVCGFFFFRIYVTLTAYVLILENKEKKNSNSAHIFTGRVI